MEKSNERAGSICPLPQVTCQMFIYLLLNQTINEIIYICIYYYDGDIWQQIVG